MRRSGRLRQEQFTRAIAARPMQDRGPAAARSPSCCGNGFTAFSGLVSLVRRCWAAPENRYKSRLLRNVLVVISVFVVIGHLTIHTA
jgi:hypothetical protein